MNAALLSQIQNGKGLRKAGLEIEIKLFAYIELNDLQDISFFLNDSIVNLNTCTWRHHCLK